MSNRLAHQTSPYLLQHADNPVDWYPWGEEALTKARREDKLVLVSIGYSACHWCHVMERETFTDPAVAALLQADFVSIKVDREERPDVDAHFMEQLLALTGQGGWPLNMFLTPDLQPLHGGSYFPPTPRHGLPSFTQVLEVLGQRWRQGRAALLRAQQGLLEQLAQISPSSPSAATSADELARQAQAYWRQRLDWEQGGIGRQPKFPQPLVLSFLLRRALAQRDPVLGAFLSRTLDQMAAGGVRDQLGGAFHRYAVDRHWLVPHFEIMLYDNALLARLYLEGYRAWGLPRHAQVARGILDDLLERFRLADGGYLSALDADSPDPRGQAVEGYYYTWTGQEIEEWLGAAAGPFLECHVEAGRGVLEGRYTLRLVEGGAELSVTESRFATERAVLRRARERRAPPGRDDKVLTSWNALLLSALALAAQGLGEERYRVAAVALADHLLTAPWQEGGLRHSRRGQRLGEMVFLEDYGFLLQGLLDLHQAVLEPVWLERAEALAEGMLARFAGAQGQPWSMTPNDQGGGLPPRVLLEDGVLPAGFSCALVGLSRLALLTGRADWLATAADLRRGLESHPGREAPGMVELLRAWDFAPERVVTVTVVGERAAPATQALLAEARRGEGLCLWLPPGAVVSRPLLDGQPTAYLCRDFHCLPPVSTCAALAEGMASPGVSVQDL